MHAKQRDPGMDGRSIGCSDLNATAAVKWCWEYLKPYNEQLELRKFAEKLGEEFEEGIQAVDICDITGRGGSCGS